MKVTDTIKIQPNQASEKPRSHPRGRLPRRRGTAHPQAQDPGLHAHPWKLPGTVILRFTSAFMTRLTIS